MKYKNTLLNFNIGLISALSLQVNAEIQNTPQPFVGLKGGYQFAIDDAYEHNAPHNDVLGIYGGLQFSKPWSWDLGYQYQDTLKAISTSIEVKTWLIESAVRYDWYLQDNMSLYGRLGAAYWNTDKDIQHEQTIDSTGFSPLTEIGMSYHLTENTHLSAGYQYIYSIGDSNTGSYDSHSILLSLSYTLSPSTMPVVQSQTPTSPPDELDSLSPLRSDAPEPIQSFKTVDTFLFETDKAKINEENNSYRLTQIVSQIKGVPNSSIILIGHTDATGPAAYNQQLSKSRAQEIKKQLIKYGTNPKQIKIKGMGEQDPIASDTNHLGRMKNRRVEVLLQTTSNQNSEDLK